MHRLVWSTLFVLAACDSVDDRPLELDYLTQAILAPTCGAAQCHSTFKQAGNIVFDNPEGARFSILDRGLVVQDSGAEHYDPTDAKGAQLIVWITEIDPNGAGIGRMPYDAPMPNKDVYLLREWIENEAPGAQCNPASYGGLACQNKLVVRCTADWNFGDRVQLCTGDCVQGACK